MWGRGLEATHTHMTAAERLLVFNVNMSLVIIFAGTDTLVAVIFSSPQSSSSHIRTVVVELVRVSVYVCVKLDKKPLIVF